LEEIYRNPAGVTMGLPKRVFVVLPKCEQELAATGVTPIHTLLFSKKELADDVAGASIGDEYGEYMLVKHGKVKVEGDGPFTVIWKK
jgi:hypothetical protein